MHTSNINNEEIIELITYKINHSFLNKYIQIPMIDQTKLTALSIIINNTSLPEETKKKYIIATMLVQIALNTHDLVPITTDEMDDELAVTTKQLTVLAGDYYSGLYYLLLAEIEDIPMINLLASSIKDITEYKMRLHYREVESFTEYLSITKKVETLLITRVAEFVNHSIINDVIGELIITSKLIEEKKHFPSQGESPVLDNWYTHSNDNSYSSILLLTEKFIQKNISKVEVFWEQPNLQNSAFRSHIQFMLEEFIYSKISVAEEG